MLYLRNIRDLPIIENINKLNFTNKLINTLFYILGFLTFVPIFINLIDLSFIFIKYGRYISHAGFVNDAPIPIGWFSITLFLVLISYRRFKSIKYYLFSFLILILFNIIFYRYELIIRLSILYPFLGFIWVNYAIKNHKEEIKIFCKGLVHSICGILSFNLLYFIASNISNKYRSIDTQESIINNFLGIDFNLARQIFNFEIYQYYISIAAIVSLISGIYLFFIINTKKPNKYNLIIYTLSSIISIITLRKIVFVENIFLTIFGFIYIIKKQTLLKNLNKIFIQLFITSINLIILMNTRISPLNETLAERNYIKFISTLGDKSLIELLFGFKSYIGGYSNLFIEVLTASGFIGLIIFIFLLVRLNQSIIRSTRKANQYINRNSFIYFIIYMNFLLGNSVNLNLALPYYSCNFLGLLLLLSSYDETLKYKIKKRI